MKSKIEELEKQVAELKNQIDELKKQQPTYDDVVAELQPRVCFESKNGNIHEFPPFVTPLPFCSWGEAAAQKNALQAKWENIAEYVNRRHEGNGDEHYMISCTEESKQICVYRFLFTLDERARFNSRDAALEALQIMGEDQYKKMIGVL